MSFGKIICPVCGYEQEKDSTTAIQLTGSVVTLAENAERIFKVLIPDVLTDGVNGDFILIFTSGDLIDQAQQITDYDASTDLITVKIAFSAIPAAGDQFILVKYK
jgi:hypothetical protein